jgi:anti-sigma factor RsiW
MLCAATRKAREKLSDQTTVLERNTAAQTSQGAGWHFLAWLVPLCSAVMIVAVLAGVPLSSMTALSPARYAEFAVRTHAQFEKGNLNLDVRSDSTQAVNKWLRQNVEFKVSLPASPGTPGEKRPFDLKGASVVHVGRRRAAFIAYQMDSGPASLMIAPYAIAVSSGGVEARFKKVTFHYRMVDGFKVVTWSQHGLTYALVSQEGTRTQKSCMVCHSAMRDRDLTNTPAPLDGEGSSIRSYLQ